MFFFPILYAEIHYRFKWFFSLLKKREPEIIADVPHRLDPGNNLPVLLIIKDAHRFPVYIHYITVYIDEKPVIEKAIEKTFSKAYSDFIIEVQRIGTEEGHHAVNVKIHYTVNDKQSICFNDNYKQLSHAPLSCYFAKDGLPQMDGLFYGESHAHSNFTNDQIEFGASIESSARLARSIGLGFWCITDHSYDLDDDENDYLRNDPQLSKWHRFQIEVKRFNQANEDFCLIAGEEVSVRNRRDRNVHFLVLNSARFYHGNGDSGEHGFGRPSKNTISDITKSLPPGAVSYAAHPRETVPFLQRLLLKRDRWHKDDARTEKIHGLQIINGGEEKNITAYIAFWRDCLLEGRRLHLLAGNDAHGNFARSRIIAMPFVKLKEEMAHRFGVWKTGVFTDGKTLTSDAVVKRLADGNFFVTNGPALRLDAVLAENAYPMGSAVSEPQAFRIHIKSSREFGPIQGWRLLTGDLQSKKESILAENNDGKQYEFQTEIKFENSMQRSYVRLETITQNGSGRFQGFGNPIWIDNDNQQTY